MTAASTEIIELLAATTPFSALPASVLADVAAACEQVFVRAGDVVLREDEEGDQAFVVVSGRLRVYATTPAGPLQVGELGSGQLFGEMALLSPGGRRATVVATRDSELLRLGAQQFEGLVVGHPSALLALVRLLVERSTARIGAASFAPPNTIAFVGVGGQRGLTKLVESIASALSRHGDAVRVDAAAVESALGPKATEVAFDSAGSLLTWLDRVERAHRFVLYETDPAHLAWTERCLRQADRIVLVVDARCDPNNLNVPKLPDTSRCDVVVLHEDRERIPRGTARLLDRLPTGRHFHVRQGSDADVQRVARQLAGAAVGLVLGGGGARGFAHLGVVRALEEANVPIDAVGGTSVGALMGALAAWGLDHTARMERALAFVAGRLTMPTLPIVSATSARRLTERLRQDQFVGDRDLVDSWLPFFCVSTNLSTARAFVHTRGPAWQALRASISLPGMMPPVCTDTGELLVDGGLVDDLPVDAMAPLLDGGDIIAVDLGISSDFRVGQRFDPSLSGWRVLMRRLSPFGPRFDAPTLLTTLLRAKEVASSDSLELKSTNHEIALLVRPPVEGFGGFDFRRADVLAERSYRHTLELLERDPIVAELGTRSHRAH
jgi:predicted acylesterase/phospholipase RssA/CRP-like cAMP-binding protein